MRYYKIAFVANVLPLEGNKAWRCYEELKLAGHAVEVLDPGMYPGILDEKGEVDLKLLESFTRVFQPDYIATEKDTPKSILSALAETTAGSDIPYRHFLIYGYVGKDNFGDELIFDTLRRKLAERYPGSFVTLIGHDPVAALRRHGVASLQPFEKARINYSLNGASGLLFMAGLLFDIGFTRCSSGLIDLFQSQRDLPIVTMITQLAYLNGVPTIFAGIGAGPLSNPDAQKILQLGSLTKPLYIARDSATVGLLLDAGIEPSLITEKADLTFSLEVPSVGKAMKSWLTDNDLSEGGYILVALREWETAPASLWREVAKALDRSYEEYGLRTVFMDFAPEDALIHNSVLEAMAHGDQAVRFGCPEDIDFALEAILRAKMVVAMRLHGSILANVFGLPSIGLDYNDKVRSQYVQMEKEELLLPLSCSSSDLNKAIDRIMSRHGELVSSIERKTVGFKQLALEAFEELFRKIESECANPVKQHLYWTIDSGEAIMLAEAWAEKDRLLCENEKLRDELRGVRESTTWRAGRFVTAIPRAIKNIIKG